MSDPVPEEAESITEATTEAPEVEQSEPSSDSTQAVTEQSEQTPPADGDEAPAVADSLMSPEGGEVSDGDAVSAAPAEYSPFEYTDGREENAVAMEHFAPVMLEHGMSQKAAQGLVDAMGSFEDLQYEANNKVIEANRVRDAEAVRADAEIGGDNFDKAMSNVSRIMSMKGGNDVNDILRAHGIDNDPTIVRWAAHVGRQFAEDNIVSGRPSGGGELRPEDATFPKTAHL